EYVAGLDPKSFYQFEHRRLGQDSYKLGIITDIAQVGGYPEYKGKAYKDSDNDGMPDAWEKKFGLNPKDASDANADLNGDGYTNIEKYINGIDPTKKVDWKNLDNNEDTLAKIEQGLAEYKK
ncbi:MAG: polysaccharide lyase, partial [Flavobacteriales bacterium 32-34-25]